MRRLIVAGVLATVSSATLANQPYRPDVQVNVPPEVFSSSGQRAQPCSQCCIYQDQNYSEGAVIKADGVLLQCQRDENDQHKSTCLASRKRINASSSGISAGASG